MMTSTLGFGKETASSALRNPASRSCCTDWENRPTPAWKYYRCQHRRKKCCENLFHRALSVCAGFSHWNIDHSYVIRQSSVVQDDRTFVRPGVNDNAREENSLERKNGTKRKFAGNSRDGGKNSIMGILTPVPPISRPSKSVNSVQLLFSPRIDQQLPNLLVGCCLQRRHPVAVGRIRIRAFGQQGSHDVDFFGLDA